MSSSIPWDSRGESEISPEKQRALLGLFPIEQQAHFVSCPESFSLNLFTVTFAVLRSEAQLHVVNSVRPRGREGTAGPWGPITRVAGSDVLQTSHNKWMAPNGKSYRKAKKKIQIYGHQENSEYLEVSSECFFYISDSKWWGGYLNFMKDRKGVLY